MSSFQEMKAKMAEKEEREKETLRQQRLARIETQEADRRRQDEEARKRSQADRDAIIAKEKRKKEETQAKELAEKCRQDQIKKAQQDKVQQMQLKLSKESRNAKNNSSIQPREGIDGDDLLRRKKRKSDSNASSSSSMLTREEKRRKKELAQLGLSNLDTSSKKLKKKVNGSKKNVVKHHPQMSTSDLIRLNTVKRDKRTIDEIERDMHTGKNGSAINKSESIDGISNGKSEKVKPRISSSSNSIANKAKSSLGLSPADYLPGAPIPKELIERQKHQLQRANTSKLNGKANGKDNVEAEFLPPPRKENARQKFIREEEERKKQRALEFQLQKEKEREKLQYKSTHYEEDYDDDEDEDEDEDDYDSDSMLEDDEPSGKTQSYRDEIWKLFGKKRSDYMKRAEEDSDDEDMEADMESVAREEAKSARIARLEDEREERLLQQKKLEKAKRKLQSQQ